MRSRYSWALSCLLVPSCPSAATEARPSQINQQVISCFVLPALYEIPLFDWARPTTSENDLIERLDTTATLQDAALGVQRLSLSSADPLPKMLESPPVAGKGAIQGMVMDDQGEAVPSVKLTAINNATNYAKKATAGECGAYILVLPVGTYSLLVVQPGLKMYRATNIVVKSLEVVTLPIQLHVGQKEKKSRRALSPSRRQNHATLPCKPPSS